MKSKKAQETSFPTDHETGHHIIAWCMGCKLGKISIQPGNGFFGVSQTYIPEAESFHVNMFTAERVLEMMAGRAATEVFCPDVDHPKSYGRDFSIIKNLNGNSETFIKMNQWRVKHSEGDIEKFYQAFKQPIIDILKSKQGKRAFKALSKELQKSGYLSGRESARILETAWGHPLPPLAVPSEQHPSLDNHIPAKNFNDFLHQMAVFERIFRKDITEWINNDANTPKQDKIVEQLSGAFNFIKILVNK